MEGVGRAGGGHAETVARREKLSAWLAGAVAEDVGRELNAARYRLTRGSPELFSTFPYWGEFTSALHVLNLTWFG
jgi:hypothetical protein